MASNLYNTASVLIPKGAAGRASVIDAYRPAFNVLQSIGITRNDANGSFRNQQGLIEFAAANVPRFNWDEGDSCPKLLVEPSRENLFLRSEQFNNAAWLKTVSGAGVAPIVTANAATAPDGTTTADRVQFDAGGVLSTDRSILSQSVTLSAADHTQTFYLKSNSGAGSQEVAIYADSNTRTSETITENSWTRVEFTRTSFGGGVGWGIAAQGNFDQTLDLLVWGAQLEEGSYATSYIKTEATTQTRAADVISQTGLASLIGDSEGTLYCEAEWFDNTATRGISINDGSFNNTVYIGVNGGTNFFQSQVRLSGSIQSNISNSDSVVQNQIYKLASCYSTNDFVLYIDGFQIGTDTSGSTFSDETLTNFELDLGTGSTPFYGKISVLAWWQARLSNSVLESLTSYETYEEMAATLDYTID